VVARGIRRLPRIPRPGEQRRVCTGIDAGGGAQGYVLDTRARALLATNDRIGLEFSGIAALTPERSAWYNT